MIFYNFASRTILIGMMSQDIQSYFELSEQEVRFSLRSTSSIMGGVNHSLSSCYAFFRYLNRLFPHFSIVTRYAIPLHLKGMNTFWHTRTNPIRR